MSDKLRHRIMCALGFHTFQRSKFVALNSRIAPLVCTRCYKHKGRPDGR